MHVNDGKGISSPGTTLARRNSRGQIQLSNLIFVYNLKTIRKSAVKFKVFFFLQLFNLEFWGKQIPHIPQLCRSSEVKVNLHRS